MNPSEPQIPITPQVSVILIARNQAAEVRRAIEALERSIPREAIEILVVDCGSTDETPDLDQSYPAVTMLRLPFDFGATKAMNIATRTAKGEFLFFLAPEVEVAPETIARLMERLESDAGASAVCPLLCDEGGRPIPQLGLLGGRDDITQLASGDPLRKDVAVSGGDSEDQPVENPNPGRDAILVRKQFIAGMNYFDERFGEFGADVDLAVRIRRTQKSVRLYPSIRVTRHPSTHAKPKDTAHRADCILGVAVLLGKHYGFVAGATFRIGQIFRALMSFDFGLFMALLSGQKLDGSHAG